MLYFNRFQRNKLIWNLPVSWSWWLNWLIYWTIFYILWHFVRQKSLHSVMSCMLCLKRAYNAEGNVGGFFFPHKRKIMIKLFFKVPNFLRYLPFYVYIFCENNIQFADSSNFSDFTSLLYIQYNTPWSNQFYLLYVYHFPPHITILLFTFWFKQK